MVNPRHSVDVKARLQHTVFGVLNSEALDQLCAAARVERYEMSSLLNAAGTPLRWLRLVVDGHIEVVTRRSSGNEVALGDIGPGGWATWLACFMPTPPDNDFYSSASACYIALPVQMVRSMCQQHPEIYPHIIGEIGARMRLLMEWTGQSVLVGPEQRMAKLIHVLARAQAIDANSGTLHVTQARLARLARCSRQSANMLLGALEKKGLIRLAYGRFEIDDLARLAAFAEQEQSD